MSDLVIIEELSVDAVIGIYDWEKTITQPLLIDLTMAWDNKPAANQDDIKLALDYEAVSNQVTALVQRQPIGLIETVAEQVAQLVMAEFAVSWVRVKIAKPTAVKAAKQVAVVIERGQRT